MTIASIVVAAGVASATPVTAAQLIDADPWGDLRESLSAADHASSGDVITTEALDNDGSRTGAIDTNAPATAPDTQDAAPIMPAVLTTPAPSRGKSRSISSKASWTSNRYDNGLTAVSVHQTLLPDLNARVGADMSVISVRPFATTSESLIDKYGSRNPRAQSGAGSAWLTLSTPGVASLWDKTNVEARLDPIEDVSRVNISLTKSMMIGSPGYVLDLSNHVGVAQNGLGTLIGVNGDHTLTASQTASLLLQDTGTRFIAGQSLSSADNKWLRRIGGEQRLIGNINLSATISETAEGPSDKALLANYRRKW